MRLGLEPMLRHCPGEINVENFRSQRHSYVLSDVIAEAMLKEESLR